MYLRRKMSYGLPNCPISFTSSDQLGTAFLLRDNNTIAVVNDNCFYNYAIRLNRR